MDERASESAAAGRGRGGGGGAGMIEWFPLLRRTRLTAHAEHKYAAGGELPNKDWVVTMVGS